MAGGWGLGSERRHSVSVHAAEGGGCKTQAAKLEIRPAARPEIHALEKKQNVMLNDISCSQPKFEIPSEGAASLLIRFPL